MDSFNRFKGLIRKGIPADAQVLPNCSVAIAVEAEEKFFSLVGPGCDIKARMTS